MAVAVGSAAQTTINVPADVATIQGAIDVANNGDTVLVAPGTYTENLDFKGKAITVVSASGAAATIIDGGQKAPVVQFVTNEPATAVLDGFTIRDGLESFGMGGGVKIRNSAPTVRNNVIRDNTGCNMSAVYLGGSSATIASNVISNNGDLGTGCSGGSGAGIYVGGSRSNGPNIIVGNQIVNNTAKNGEGGGVALNGAGNVVFQNNLVKGNSAYDTGGIWIINSVSELIVGNVIVDNVSALANNRQVSGVYLSVPYNSRGAYLLNNTISSGAQTGNAVYIAGYYSATPLTNNIIFGNNSDATVHCDPVYSSQPPLFSHNDLYSPLANAYEGTCGAVLGNNGNISAAPLFMDLAGGNYRLQPTSPAIDAG
ncbi:MAG TPA: right-handed parallel beta-helix repeat-containing protein, partial [Terriglobales bacterium]|nr:right-handed parallel beta-helix repeat-containing protein [Terriglobales bacterium]